MEAGGGAELTPRGRDCRVVGAVSRSRLPLSTLLVSVSRMVQPIPASPTCQAVVAPCLSAPEVPGFALGVGLVSSLLVSETTAKMSSKRAKTKTTKKRPQRATSNVFAMFDQSQIQEFKEAFNMIDQNRDGFIDKEDLHDMLASLGKNPTDEYLDAMMNEAPGPINFTMFLTMFGEKLNGTDPEDVIRNAFACFDEEATGFIQEDYLRELLTTMGDRFTDEEVDELYREAPIDKKGNFNYIEFTRILKHGAKDKDD
uniref:Myosin regulatory light chain 2, smooth muscle minor isoform n=1 Tax=Crocodylus porosus TaxID=8502 RepID=A0A7M4F1U8_CROPO